MKSLSEVLNDLKFKYLKNIIILLQKALTDITLDNVKDGATRKLHAEYTLPTATTTTRGGIIVGSGLTITNGVLSNAITAGMVGTATLIGQLYITYHANEYVLSQAYTNFKFLYINGSGHSAFIPVSSSTLSDYLLSSNFDTNYTISFSFLIIIKFVLVLMAHLHLLYMYMELINL